MSSQTERLKKHGLAIRGHLGQHLLIDPNIQSKIVDLLKLNPHEPVIEIGPGLGALTDLLLEKDAKVWAIEKDPRFIPVLEEEIGAVYPDRFHIIHADILKTSLNDVVKRTGSSKVKLIGNLPYYITAPILVKLVEEKEVLKEAVVMIQKEVADRIAAKPKTKSYGRLTLLMNYYATVKLAFKVPASCFTPKPEVGSAVIHIDFIQREHSQVDETWLFHLIQTAFSQRRKTLAHLLSSDPQVPLRKAEVQEIFKKMNFSEKVRGEELSIDDYIQLARFIPRIS